MDTSAILQHFGESVPTYIAMIGTQIAVIWVTIRAMKQNQEERDQVFRERMSEMESEQKNIRTDFDHELKSIRMEMGSMARQYQDVARDTAVIREKVEWIVKSLDDLKRK
jgi:hypothetical protein